MKVTAFGHNHGDRLVPADISSGLIQALESVNVELRRHCADDLRQHIFGKLRALGWSKAVSVLPDAKITISAVNRSVGLCVQFGNVARYYADLLKLQTLFQRDCIEFGVLLVPTNEAASKMGSNLTNFSRVTQELVYYKHTITVPMLILGIGEE